MPTPPTPTAEPTKLRRASDAPALSQATRLARLEESREAAEQPLERLWLSLRLRGAITGSAFSGAFHRGTKRLIDVVAASTALLLLSPLFAALALLIKRCDGGPVFFWQTRVGIRGSEFRMPKFRSMTTDAERLKDSLLSRNDHGNGITFKMKNDPRVTPIGRVIRKFSLDELPQLWCVLKGEMTLVGPRPPVPREVAGYSVSDRRRLEVRPGLTCLWQVGGRGDLPFEKQVELDVEYIERQCLWLDMVLLFKTIPAVLGGRGAY